MRALLVMFVLTALVPDRPDPSPPEIVRPLPELLIGEWRVFKEIHGGNESPDSGLSLLFTAKSMQHVHYRGGNRQLGGTFTYTLDTKKLPVVISFLGSNEAIIKIEGEVLTICFSPSGMRQPPAEFHSPPAAGFTIMQARRTKN